MEYAEIKEGIFISRPNRFIAHVNISGEEHIVHVKNTGRCKEIFLPDATVFLEDHTKDMRNRKTRFSLVAAEKSETKEKSPGQGQTNIKKRLINIDSQAPNKIVGESLSLGLILLPGMESGLSLIRPEQSFGNSRFDFYLEGNGGEKAYLEVKGVTLEEGGVARFPDAPTERGVKHIYELVEAAKQGYKAYIVFIIQMQNIIRFEPNDITHPAFGEALRFASKNGVALLAYDCHVTARTLNINDEVKVVLPETQ
jgi:sugar fermentation stimulation protein A